MAVEAPRWTLSDLSERAHEAVDIFRESRDNEPAELYAEFCESSRSDVEDTLETTIDLQLLQENAAPLLRVERYRSVLRYLAGPPISTDDLRNLSGKEIYTAALRGQASAAEQVLRTLLPTLDRTRFPWVAEGREPTPSERESAVIATTALLATQRTQTARRNAAKVLQETRVKNALREAGFEEVDARTINTPSRAPKPGQFCGESSLVGKKADVVIGLWDERVMPIECKTSNSEVNSYKRVNHEAGGKATHWITKFGQALIVPAVTLAGVFSPQNLFDAQSAGLTVWWSHDLEPMKAWVDSTRS